MLQLTQAANGDLPGFVERLRTGFAGTGSISTTHGYGSDDTASITYVKPQTVASGRTRGTRLRISSPRPLRRG